MEREIWPEILGTAQVDQMVVKICCKIVFCVSYNIKERSKLGLSNINYSFRKAELPVFREVNCE